MRVPVPMQAAARRRCCSEHPSWCDTETAEVSIAKERFYAQEAQRVALRAKARLARLRVRCLHSAIHSQAHGPAPLPESPREQSWADACKGAVWTQNETSRPRLLLTL